MKGRGMCVCVHAWVEGDEGYEWAACITRLAPCSLPPSPTLTSLHPLPQVRQRALVVNLEHVKCIIAPTYM